MRLSHDSLLFRLGVPINLAALAVLLIFGVGDYRRERSAHLQEMAERLREEADVLRVARQQLADAPGFQRYVDAYCRQMRQSVSPGHHIVLVDANRRVLARSHTHTDSKLEAEMVTSAQGKNLRRFRHNGEDFMVAGVTAGNGSTILVAQSLRPVERIIRRQVINRAASMAALIALVMAVTHGLVWWFVQRPIHQLMHAVEAVRKRRFDYRVEPLNSAELQFLANGLNRMRADLESVELHRRSEMERARRIHMGLLPPALTTIPGLSMAARYIPADGVGGDYYDLLKYRDGRWLIVIADVSGHGVPAALVTALIKALLRQVIDQNCPLQDTVQILNHELESLTGPEYFVTFVATLYDPETFELQYINCGHEPGVILGSDGEIKRRLQSSGVPLGIDPEASWEIGSLVLEPADRLYLVTDGLVEVENRDGHILGRDRLLQFLRNCTGGSPHQAAEQIFQEIRRFRGEASFADDATLVTLWRDG